MAATKKRASTKAAKGGRTSAATRAKAKAKKKPAPAKQAPAKKKPAPARKPPAKKKPAPARKKPAPAKKAPVKKAAPARKAAPATKPPRRLPPVRAHRPEPVVERDRGRLLREGERFGTATVAHHQVATLHLPSGKIVTCDPLVVDGPTLARRVRPGGYPVTLAVVTFPDGAKGEQIIAAAIVRFAPGEVARWEVAGFDGAVGGDATFAVDAGTACFMDAGAQAAIAREPNHWPTPSQKAIEKQLMTDHYAPTWGWAVYQPDPGSPANCVAFMSGWGDGTYQSAWGLDQAGEPVLLLMDFDVLTDEDWTA